MAVEYRITFHGFASSMRRFAPLQQSSRLAALRADNTVPNRIRTRRTQAPPDAPPPPELAKLERRGEEQPHDRGVEGCVDREAGPDHAKRQKPDHSPSDVKVAGASDSDSMLNAIRMRPVACRLRGRPH